MFFGVLADSKKNKFPIKPFMNAYGEFASLDVYCTYPQQNKMMSCAARILKNMLKG